MFYFRHGDPDDDFRELERKRMRIANAQWVCNCCGDVVDDGENCIHWVAGELTLCGRCVKRLSVRFSLYDEMEE